MSEHASHEMHQHSLDAHEEERAAGKLSKRCQLISDVLGWERLTDREILERTPYRDMNAIRPRVTEMIQAGILEEVGEKRDKLTGKMVRVVARRNRQTTLF